MHTGEEWFILGWPQYAAVGTIIAVYLILVFANKLPSMASFKDFADTVNSAGGHIIVLSAFSAWFFVNAMRFFFHVLGLPDEVITKHEAIVMTGVGFLTGTAFGGAWGALIKTMSGGKANGNTPPSVDVPVQVSVSSPTPGAPPTVTGAAPAGKMGFVPNRQIGDVGDRGTHGDLGENNSRRMT